MFLSNASVKRPIAMASLIIGLSLLGFNAWRKMGLELMPKVDIPYITITTIYPGATPDQIETDLAKRIEDQMASLDGLKHISSTCLENVCNTLLEFHLNVDVDIAATDVREQTDLIRSEFPEDVEDPQILKYDINAKPIATLAFTGDLSIDELYDYADNTLRDRLSVISGVADITLVGGAEREVRILLDRAALAGRGLTTLDVARAVQQSVRTLPAGRVRDHGSEFSVKFDGEVPSVKALESLELMSGDGKRCTVRDVGRAAWATEELRERAELDGRPAIAIKVVKKSDANAVTVVQRVRDTVQALRSELHGGMELVWVTDDGRFTEAMNMSAWVNVTEGILLTGAILFFFLYNLRTLLVVAITMPVTVVIGLFFMQAIGFTLNAPTLIAIGMSVGILVTNSIVVIEAIVKQLETSGNAKEAAMQGAAKAFIPVLASAGTNIVVLFPMSVMESMVGLFIRSFAMTMLIMTSVSLFISFTLTPLLCSLILREMKNGAEGRLARMERGWNQRFERSLKQYRGLLVFFERRRWAATALMAVMVLAVLHALHLAGALGTGMGLDSDRGEVYVKLEFPTHYNLAHSVRRVHEVQAALGDVPELRHQLTTIGKTEAVFGQASEGVNLAQILLTFSDKTDRPMPIDTLIAEVRQRLAGLPEAQTSVSVPSIMGGQSSDLELEISGDELATLDRLALQAADAANAIPGIFDVDTSVREGKPEIRVSPSRSVLSDIHLPETSLGLVLRGNLEGLKAGTYTEDARNYDIVVKLKEEEGTDQVRAFGFPGADGRAVSLEALGGIEHTTASAQILRKDKQRIAKVFADLESTLPLGVAVEQVRTAIGDSEEWSSGYGMAFAGLYEIMSEGNAGLAEAGVIAIILVILTLAAILESFKQPGLILMTLPLALIGMVWAVALGGYSMELFVLMGGVMLIGIVVNNAILIMSQFNLHTAEGIPRHQAMMAAAVEQLRPIVMITLAAVLGMMPLAFGRGLGAEMRHSVGLASAGGILVSGVLTLLVLPVLYDLLTRRERKEVLSK